VGAAVFAILAAGAFSLLYWARLLQLPGQRREEAPPPVPWEEARRKAALIVSRLSDQELHLLVHGYSNWHDGFYVGNTESIPRMGVPALKMQDASGGFRTTEHGETGTTTQWPCMLAIASSWDEGLMSDVAAAIGREFRGKGANVVLGPAVNVHRSAFGGRNMEYLSGEDPYLGARLSRAYVRAVQSQGVMTVVKHFAFNEQETNRMTVSTEVDARTAWELYYPPFQAAVDAGAGAVMCAYNRLNGTYACQNEELLKRDLRDSMGFQGFVMSDWDATHSTGALVKGLDMEQPSGVWFSDANLSKKIAIHEVREAAQRVLSTVFRLRLDQQQGCEPPCLKERRSNQRTPRHMVLARRAATASVTLLQNDGTLPLDPERRTTIAVMGVAANATDTQVQSMWYGSYYSGGGSGRVKSRDVVSPLRGILARASGTHVRVLHYGGDKPWEASEVAKGSDVVVFVAAASAKEGDDRTSLDLDANTDELIAKVATVRPTVVLMQTPGAVLTPWRDKVAAVANLFLGGEQTGHAWAALLFGDGDGPTGRLPVAFPAREENAIRPAAGGRAKYSEGLLTSYRSSQVTPAYPFGHGLTFTEFGYDKLEVAAGCPEDIALCLRIVVTNRGKFAGIEVVQAYLRFSHAPEEPRLNLRGFERTRLLQPGESQELRFTFTNRDLSVYSLTLGWVRSNLVEVHVGASSADIRRSVKLSDSGMVVTEM
jgi:beta-glucosidase